MGLMGAHFEKVAEGEEVQRQFDGAGAKPAATVAAKGTTDLTPVATRSLKAGGTGASGGGGGGGGGGAGLLDMSVSSADVAKAARAGQLGEDAEARRVLSDPNLVEILRDPQIQQCMHECRADGSRIVHYMRIPEVRAKLLVMNKAGLIRLEGFGR